MNRSAKERYLLAASVAILTLLVYLPALHNNFVEWDDGNYVSENYHIRSMGAQFFQWAFSTFSMGNWHPLTWISHALDFAVWGVDPLGHHLTSIMLHALNTFLVVVLMISLLDAFKTKQSSPFMHDRTSLIAAGTTGLLFGLHPVHVESVAWVAERKDVLCGLFFLLSIIAYTKYSGRREPGARKQEPGVRNQKSGAIRKNSSEKKNLPFNKYYLLTLGFFVLALMSKPMAVTLPIVLLILDWHPFDRIRSLKTFQDACMEKLPFFLMSLASSIATVFAQKAGGALSSFASVPLSTRVIVAAKALIAYLGKMIWPLNLVPYYPYPGTASFASWEYFAPFALAAGITVLCVVLAAKKRKVWLAAWGYYCGTLVPVLGIVQVGGQAMADRYTYLPSLGPFLVLGLGAAWLWEKVPAQKKLGPFLKLFVVATAACMVFFLCFATIGQTGVWKDSLSLWTHVIDREPEVSHAYNNRGLAYDDMGRFDMAIEDFTKAIMLAPSDYKAYSNRGKVYGKLDLLDKAIEDFQQAITLGPSHPEAYNNLGITFARAGLVDKALEQFNNAILVDQTQGAAYYNRGLLYSRTGNNALATSDYQKACALGYNDACNALQVRIIR